jgi:hypothetical protein
LAVFDVASNIWLALIGGAKVVFTASDTWTAVTSEQGSFCVQLNPPINTGNQWIEEADLGVTFIVSTFNDLGTQAGAYTRPLLSSTSAISDTKYTLTTP